MRTVLGLGIALLVAVLFLCAYGIAARDPYALLAAAIPAYIAILMVAIPVAELHDAKNNPAQ